MDMDLWREKNAWLKAVLVSVATWGYLPHPDLRIFYKLPRVL